MTMKMAGLTLLALVATTTMAHAAVEGSPVSKVFEMLAGLQQKIIAEGTEAQKTYDEFSEWCDDRSKSIGFEITTAKAEIEELNAAIEKSASQTSASGTQIEELSSSIAK